MSLSDFATFSTAISGLAVTASLIYLALQTHQSAKHTRALIQQGQSDRVVNVLLGLSNSDLAAAFLSGNGSSPTPEAVKQMQFATICNAAVYDMQDFHNQHLDGLTSEEQFGGACMGFATLLQMPGVREYWKQWRDLRTDRCPKFIAWVDELASNRATAGRKSPWI